MMFGRAFPKTLAPGYAVMGQVAPADVQGLKDLGFACLINNRPDGEGRGQPTSAALQAAAQACGMAYLYLPIEGPATPAQIEHFRAIWPTLPKPAVAFCLSGGRSVHVWQRVFG